MAEYDEIKVGNLYRNGSNDYFVLLECQNKSNILTIPVVSANDRPRPSLIPTKDSVAVAIEDTFLACKILLVRQQEILQRNTTVRLFWMAFDCVAEVPDKSHI